MGIIIILISGLFFTFSSYFGKVVTNTTDMSGVINSFSRFFLGFIIMLIYMVYTKKNFKAPNIKPIALRAIFNSVSIILFSIAYNYTTITNINMLHMTFPLFVILLVPYFTKEKVKKTTYLYLTVIMIGTYIVANPRFGNLNVGDFLALSSAIIAAFSIMYLTESRKENEGYLIVFYVMFFGTLINIPIAFKDLLSFDISGIIPVMASATLGFLGQVFLTWGYKYVDSATGAMVATSRIIMSAIIGILLLGEPFNIRIIIGMILITLSLIGISGYLQKKVKV